MNENLRDSNKMGVNKLKRYKIGLLFFIIFLLSNFIADYLYNSKMVWSHGPFTIVYIYISTLSPLLAISFIFEKIRLRAKDNLKKILNIFQYYTPEWRKQAPFNVSNSEYMAISNTNFLLAGSNEQFKRDIHRISILLMLLLYISGSLSLKGYELSEVKIDNISFMIISILLVIILRKYMLYTPKMTILSGISFVLTLVGVVILFISQLEIFMNTNQSDTIIWIYVYPIIGGIFFGIFSVLVKSYYNHYGENFQISRVFGFVGLYCLILVPIPLALLVIFDFESPEIPDKNNWPYLLLYLAVIMAGNITACHCLISLSPLIFNFGMLLNSPIGMILYAIIDVVQLDYKFILAMCFLLFGVVLTVLDKYLKVREKKSYLEMLKNMTVEDSERNEGSSMLVG